ncbi:MFS general substrate transporter [Fomitiporia mediterranea MF3/22]|uniref:MFS general substrate transporter n=1 Tax=Fomitiporia mediterranea (strain MF3/22) TaxID=694068 RepID=UPI000440963B|nr:MFS general substrate transporter [Fomitiporia mediterranea MF3/22]EJC99321.1 MFS general substrate transporter [Fomitiporia mediterranea MF3/22]
MTDDKLPIKKSGALNCDAGKARFDIEFGKLQPLSGCVEKASSEAPDTEEPSNTINEKRLLRRIDLTIIPWLAILYMLCFLDRSNIGNARLYNLEADLHISDAQYLICLSLFYVPYVLCEVPANMCLKRTRPSIWLPILMLLWGITMTMQGLVHDYGSLLTTRIFLGIFEAGFYPGVAFYMSCWYRRDEFGLRFAIFYSGTSIAGAFNGFFAAAISNMDGVAGKPVWAWIFILEGLITVVASTASFIIIQDYPSTARFLSEQERVYIVHRLQTDDQFSDSEEQLRWRDVRSAFTDWKTWLGGLISCGSTAGNNNMSFFLPTIISQLGFTANKANLLTVPVHLVAAAVSCLVNYSADRFRIRGLISIGLFVFALTGCLMQMLSRNAALSYFATYMIALWGHLISVYPATANILAWSSNNIHNSYKRSISVAIIISMSNVVGVISINLFREQDAPRYTPGNSFSVAATVVGLVSSISLHVLLRRENARRDRGERDEVIGDAVDTYGDIRNGRYDSVEAAKRDKGDEWIEVQSPLTLEVEPGK